LARRLGISQPSVSNWTRVPADRVVAVEQATGIPRGKLRPDLYREGEVSGDDVDLARAQEYALLAGLLSREPSAELLTRISGLRADPSPLGLLHAELADAAQRLRPDDVQREYFDLFIGIGCGELLPYASYYLTGFLHERPLARLREDLAAIGIERVEGVYEPEDHIAIMFEVMSGLAAGRLSAPAGADRKIFERHLQPWAGRFFADLENAKSANFYRKVGSLGRAFMEIEAEAFALAA
jgi:TorA maturation chaperone TorD